MKLLGSETRNFITRAWWAMGASESLLNTPNPSFYRVTIREPGDTCMHSWLCDRKEVPKLWLQIFYNEWWSFLLLAVHGDISLDSKQACLLLWKDGLCLSFITVSKHALCSRGKCYIFQGFWLYKHSWKDSPEKRVVKCLHHKMCRSIKKLKNCPLGVDAAQNIYSIVEVWIVSTFLYFIYISILYLQKCSWKHCYTCAGSCMEMLLRIYS